MHSIRNSFRYAGRQHREDVVKALKHVYTVSSEHAVKDQFAKFIDGMGPAISDHHPALGILVA